MGRNQSAERQRGCDGDDGLFLEDYGLNVADNTPFYIWAIWHHWQQYQDVTFRADYRDSVQRAAEYLISEIGPNGLLVGIPSGEETRGITSWRNIIPGAVMAGESTEINSLSGMALRMAGELLEEPRYSSAGEAVFAALNHRMWTGATYLLNRTDGVANAQVTGDMIFPLITGAASSEKARAVLARLGQPDFWTQRGMMTLPRTDPAWDPTLGYGLLGGSWPNLTLWYAAAAAPYDPDRALAALEMVARPVVEPQGPEVNVHFTEFAEWFRGDNDANGGMHLSPWVAPTFLWAVLEGLLGLKWVDGRPVFNPRWPSGWGQVEIENFPCAVGAVDVRLIRDGRASD